MNSPTPLEGQRGGPQLQGNWWFVGQWSSSASTKSSSALGQPHEEAMI